MNSEASDRFRERLADDLSRSLGAAIEIVDLGLDEGSPAVVWVTCRSAERTWSMVGSGETVLVAYERLLVRAGEGRLREAFRAVVS